MQDFRNKIFKNYLLSVIYFMQLCTYFIPKKWICKSTEIPILNNDSSLVIVAYQQCWRKLLLKVMHYNIALLPKKVTNYVTFMESNALYYFCITF